MSRRKQAPPLDYPGEPQRDLGAECGITCPTCGGPFRAAVKVCRKCGKPIGRSERWRMVPASPGLVALEHTEPCGFKAEAA